MDVQQSLGIDDLGGMLRRRWAAMATIVGATLLGSVLVAGWLPNTYQAATMLLIEPQSISERLVEPGVPETRAATTACTSCRCRSSRAAGSRR